VPQFAVAGIGPGELDPALGHVTEKVVEKLLHRFRIRSQVHFSHPKERRVATW